MRLLVSGATATIRKHPDNPYLGRLLVPAAGNSVRQCLATGLPWAADNGAFAGFDAAAFCVMLGKIAPYPGCRFVCCPDVVGNAAETAKLFPIWQPVIKALGLPVALVLQDGQEEVGVPWELIDATFIGGSTEFKLGSVAKSLTRETKARGCYSHMGRVNTWRRFRSAYELGCDSVDGSSFSRFPDTRIPMALRWMEGLHNQERLAL